MVGGLQLLGFLNTLCGPNASNLKVKDMDRYAFDPTRLVLQISSVLVQAWGHDCTQRGEGEGEGRSFVECLAAHPDLSMATMNKCVSVLRNSTIGETTLVKFVQLLEKVRRALGYSGLPLIQPPLGPIKVS